MSLDEREKKVASGKNLFNFNFNVPFEIGIQLYRHTFRVWGGRKIVRNEADANSRVEGRCMMKTPKRLFMLENVYYFRKKNYSNGNRALTC
jgi:hypothetical protein